jgi:hypothetical protein
MGESVVMPFHVKLSLEGLPHHAWFQEIADKVVGDEALIHHVEQATRRKEDLKIRGQWSESMEAALCSSELGKWSSQSNVQKTRSSLTKVGELLDEELDQVNL